jgi:adenosylcobinamide-GDP ribazoletransferase
MRSLVSFLTTIPTGEMSLEDAARKSYLFPVVAVFIGLIVGSFSSMFFHHLPPTLATLLTILILYLVTGINHIDGFADFADGIYVMGNKERKIRAMKDVQLGVASFLALFFLLSFYLFSFHEIAGAVSLIIVAEVSAKTATLSSIYFGKSRGEGLGSIFIKHLNRKAYPLSVVFSLLACFYLAHYAGLIAIGVGLLTSILLVASAHRGFGCVTGDVMGAVNETTRVIVLLTLAFLR